MNAYAEAAKLMAQVQRAGARHSAKDMGMVQEMHDRACELGAKCNCEGMMTTHPMMKGALVLRHPGHPNQKVHGNRFGGYEVTKESLRRLKGDKEATAKYKDIARKKGTERRQAASAKETEVQVRINQKHAERDRLQGTIDAGNLKPKYRKERAQQVSVLEREIEGLRAERQDLQEFIRTGRETPRALARKQAEKNKLKAYKDARKAVADIQARERMGQDATEAKFRHRKAVEDYRKYSGGL